LVNHFKLSGTVTLSLNVSDPAHGTVRINTLELGTNMPGPNFAFPWSGIYLRDIPVTFEAVAAPGYVFSHWEGLGEMHNSKTKQSFLSGSASVKAHFKTATALYYWNFNALSPDTLQQVVSSYSYNNAGVLTYAGVGEGYMDRVNEGTLLNAAGEAVAGYGLRVRNPSNQRYVLIEAPTIGFRSVRFSYATMRTSSGAGFQEIQYKTSSNGNWNSLSTVRVEESWQVYSFNISDPDAENNLDFSIRILFRGDDASGETGNNRFDNIRIEGMDYLELSTTDLSENPLHKEFKIWYSQKHLNFENNFPGEAELSIYSINGTQIQKYHVRGTGMHSIPFEYAGGVYIARLIATQGAETGKFIIGVP
jgi:hypothetical protein